MSVDLGRIGYRVELSDREYRNALRSMEQSTTQSTENISVMFRRMATGIAGAFALREGLDSMRRFSDELANIKTIAQEFDTRTLRREILNLSSTLGSSAELANALYYAYSAGVRGSEREMTAFVGQIARLAKTVGAGVTPVMDAATTMMNAYNLSVRDAGNLSDWFYQIVKAGKTTGSELAQSLGQIAATAASSEISLDELGAALATLTTTMPTNIAVTSLAASIRTIMNPTDETAKLARQLGIDLSMAAIQAKGFGAVMQDIYDKTGGRGDLIAQLFPAESSRAIMALAGTQIATFQQNIIDFSNKAGAAEIGFAEKMQSLDERINALTVTGQKVLQTLADMIVQFVTLGGTLNPVIEWITSLGERGIGTAAKISALTLGLVAVRKTINGLSSVRNGILNLAVQGGYRTEAMREAAQVQAAEEAKRLAAEKSAALRQMAEQRRHYQSMRNAEIERQTALRNAQENVNIANRQLRQAQVNNQAARTRHILSYGNDASFTDTRELRNAQTAQAQAIATARRMREEQRRASQALNEASNAYSAARQRVRAANAAIDAHAAATARSTTALVQNNSSEQLNTAVRNTNTAAQGANTAAQGANSAARTANSAGTTTNNAATSANSVATTTNTAVTTANTVATGANAAAHGVLTTAVTVCRAAVQGLRAAIVANPTTWILAGIGVLMSAAIALKDHLESIREQQMKLFDEAVDEAVKKRQELSRDEKLQALQITRLEQLAEKQRLSNQEQQEAINLINSLRDRYGEIGISIDETTGRIVRQTDAVAELNAKMKQQREIALQEEISSRKSRLAGLYGEFQSSFGSNMIGRWLGYDGSISMLSDEQLSNVLRNKNVYGKMRDIITKILEERRALRDIAVGRSIDEAQGAAEQQSELQSAINAETEAGSTRRRIDQIYAKTDAMAAGVASRENEIRQLEQQIRDQQSTVTEKNRLFRETSAQKGAGHRDTLSAEENAAQERLKLYEMQTELEEKKRELQASRNELAREIALEQKKSELSTDGELSAEDRLAILKTEIQLQKGRVAEARSNAERIGLAGKNSQEYLDAVSKQEQAMNRLYELQRKYREDKFAFEDDELMERQRRQSLALEIKLRSDGSLSQQDRIEQKQLEIAQIVERAAVIQQRISDETNPVLRRKMIDEYNQLYRENLINHEELKKMQNGSPQNAVGSWSAQMLNAMLGTGRPEQETAKNTRIISRDLHDVKQIVSNGSSGQEKYSA